MTQSVLFGNDFNLIYAAKKGIRYNTFAQIASDLPFSLKEWSNVLHTSERTLQRYINKRKKFEIPFSDTILQIACLYRKGIDVFGSAAKFNHWMETENIALGKTKPKDIIDSSFGVNLLNQELGRIEHGILG